MPSPAYTSTPSERGVFVTRQERGKLQANLEDKTPHTGQKVAHCAGLSRYWTTSRIHAEPVKAVQDVEGTVCRSPCGIRPRCVLATWMALDI